MSYWDKTWSSAFGYNKLSAAWHHASIFSAYTKLLDGRLSSPDILEVGAGTGELTARLVQRYGGTATLLDSSSKALKIARSVFNRKKLPVKLIKADLFKFAPRHKYDLVHSEGLIEHFLGAKQDSVIKFHKRCAKPGGLVLICVPRPVWYYKITKKICEFTRTWRYGFEQPISAPQLKRLLEKNGLNVLLTMSKRRFAFALAKKVYKE